MIKSFNKFKKMNETTTSPEQLLVDEILDKIGNVGYKNISKTEKEILSKASKDGVSSLTKYINDSDDFEEKLSFDKLGHILINGVPYSEWSMMSDEEKKEKNKKNKPMTDWNSTGKSTEPTNDYTVRVYKNNGNKTLYYYIVWIRGDNEGLKKKFITISDDPQKKPYGIIKDITSWKNKTMDDIHETHLKNSYDQFKDLTDGELKEFESFLILRRRFIKKEFNDPKNKRYIDRLNTLYNKFSNI